MATSGLVGGILASASSAVEASPTTKMSSVDSRQGAQAGADDLVVVEEEHAEWARGVSSHPSGPDHAG